MDISDKSCTQYHPAVKNIQKCITSDKKGVCNGTQKQTKLS